jgi:hypothetical protein
LQSALLREGIGTDRAWDCIGAVVAEAVKQHGRTIPNWANANMPRFGNTEELDPLFLRNRMRRNVRDYYEQLRRDGKWNSNDPLEGLDPSLVPHPF